MSPAPTNPKTYDREPLAATLDDGDGFRDLVEPHRTELHAHCYRMLGSLHDAEDALQETLLRAWRGRSRLDDRGLLRAWLYRIATNVCLDAIKRRPKRVLPVDYGPPSQTTEIGDAPVVESVWIEPYPDELLEVPDGLAAPEASYEQREAVELAFIAALQHLPANQRAALIFREVLGYSARETAESLETSVASVNSALQRARRSVEERLPERSQQATLRDLGEERAQRIAIAYAEAWNRDDIETVTAMLADDATFAMPPIPSWWRGRDAIIALKQASADSCPEARFRPTRVNGQLALGWYSLNEDGNAFEPSALEVIDLEGDRVKGIVAFVGSHLHVCLGLPETLPAS